MPPSQIIPALPRQKVRYEPTGEVAHVLNVGRDGQFVSVQIVATGILEEWQTKFCEPVPEEPRLLRVGDKCVCTYDYGSKESLYGAIDAISTNGDVWFSGSAFGKEFVRHATPEEIVAHFAPNV